MEFSETGLPLEAVVFGAFSAQAKTNGGEATQIHATRVAQTLLATTGEPSMAALAYLAYIPDIAYGALEKRFGKDIMDSAREISRHMRTGFAYIEDASPVVRQFAAADIMAHISGFDEALDGLVRESKAFQAFGAKGGPSGSMPAAPDVKIVNHVAKYKTGNAALDEALLEKVLNYTGSIQEKLEMLGEELPAPREYVPFEKTGLLQDDKVKRAYEALASDPRATAYGINLALEAAILLGSTPATRNSTAIAAAIIDIGMPQRGYDDTVFLQKRVDWDVAEVLSQYKVHNIRSAREVVRAPVEFRLVAIANAVTTLHYAEKEGKEAFASLAQDEKPSASAPFVKQHTLYQLGSRVQSAGFVQPAAATVDAPELQGLFETKLKALQELVAANTPKPQLLLAAPKSDVDAPMPKPKNEDRGGVDLY